MMKEVNMKELEEKIKKLEPLTYLDWERLKMIVDEYFSISNKKLSLNNELKNDENLEEAKKRWFPNSQ
nr:MAG TPA: hypothetical protein [Caudoviricetes sp.]